MGRYAGPTASRLALAVTEPSLTPVALVGAEDPTGGCFRRSHDVVPRFAFVARVRRARSTRSRSLRRSRRHFDASRAFVRRDTIVRDARVRSFAIVERVANAIRSRYVVVVSNARRAFERVDRRAFASSSFVVRRFDHDTILRRARRFVDTIFARTTRRNAICDVRFAFRRFARFARRARYDALRRVVRDRRAYDLPARDAFAEPSPQNNGVPMRDPSPTASRPPSEL